MLANPVSRRIIECREQHGVLVSDLALIDRYLILQERRREHAYPLLAWQYRFFGRNHLRNPSSSVTVSSNGDATPLHQGGVISNLGGLKGTILAFQYGM